jgi:hypothetical protein
MERRDLLGTLTAIGAVGIAGCSENATPGDGSVGDGNGGDGNGDDGNGGDGDTGGDGTSDGEESGADNDASLYIAKAVSTLNAVAIRLNKTKERLDTPEEIDLDDGKLLDGIEEARGQLDSATETATDVQTERIETLRNLATVLEEVTLVVSSIRDVDPQAIAEDAKTAVNDEDYETALSIIRDGQAKAETARDRTRTATNALRGVDPDRLAAVEGVEYEKVENAVTTTHEYAKAFVAVTDGYESTILGAQDLETGRDHIESKEWTQAKTEFGKANEHFAAATDTLEPATGDAPESIAGRIDTAVCQTTHLQAASKHFEQAAAAAEDGDIAESRDQRDEGEADYNKVDDCTSN